MDISFKTVLFIFLAFIAFVVALFKYPSIFKYLGIVGIIANLLGAVLYIRGDLRSEATLVRYHFRNMTEEEWNRHYNLHPWWKRFAFDIGRRIGSEDMRDTQQPLVDSYPMKFWGISLILLGASFQIIAFFIK
jgi:hypothetical protein